MTYFLHRIIASLFICFSITGSPIGAEEAANKNQAKKYMVSAANPHAARARLEILKAGGSAVDAAIAVEAVLRLVEPQSSGIGGGAFLMHYDADGKKGHRITAYDGRETAPAAAPADMFKDVIEQKN